MREPFYGHIAGQLKRCVTDRVSTAAVTFDSSGDIELLVNPSFFIDELNVDERVAVIMHELLHVVLQHLSRLDWKKHNPQLLNLAADIVVNQYVKPWPLPEGAVTLATFPELNLPAAAVRVLLRNTSKTGERLSTDYHSDHFRRLEAWRALVG